MERASWGNRSGCRAGHGAVEPCWFAATHGIPEANVQTECDRREDVMHALSLFDHLCCLVLTHCYEMLTSAIIPLVPMVGWGWE